MKRLAREGFWKLFPQLLWRTGPQPERHNSRQLLGGYIWQTQLEPVQEHLVDGRGNS